MYMLYFIFLQICLIGITFSYKKSVMCNIVCISGTTSGERAEKIQGLREAISLTVLVNLGLIVQPSFSAQPMD